MMRFFGPVTTGRNDVNYIVTEYGVAQLRGQTLWERARRLINIAHPKLFLSCGIRVETLVWPYYNNIN